MECLEINRYWKRIVDTMHDGLIVVSPEGRILMVNQAFEQLTGYTSDEVIGKPCTLLKCDACELAIKSEENKGWWCALFHPDHEGMKRCGCSYMKKDGTYIPVLKNASVLRDENGNPLGEYTTIDWTEKQKIYHNYSSPGDESSRESYTLEKIKLPS